MPLQKVANTDISTTGSFSFPVISGNTVIQATDNTNAALRITQLGTGNALVVEDSANPDSTPFVVDASGSVGIGTTTPANPLHVNGTSAGLIRSQVFNAGNLIDYYTAEGSSSSPTALLSDRQIAGLRSYGYNGTSYLLGGSIDFQAESAWSGSASPSYFRIRTMTGAGVLSERMRVSSNGRVGIATTTPQTTLDVFGTIQANSVTVTANTVVPDLKAFQVTSPDRHTIRPSLLLDFANSKVLDPRITFTRASTGTYYDGKTVAKAEENLILYSEQFDNSGYWRRLDVSVTANTTTAPNGTNTADSLIESTSAGTSHGIDNISGAIPTIVGQQYTISIYAKSNGRQWFAIDYYDNNIFNTWFDLTNGVVGGNAAGSTATITSVGNGWYRCTVTRTSATTSLIPQFYIASANNVFQYTGDGVSGTFIWGAQVEQRSSATAYTTTTTAPITNYIPVLLTAAANIPRFEHNPITGESLGLEIEEQRTNLLTYSEDLSDASWTKTRCSVTANTIVAPNGTLSGNKLIENTDNNTHILIKSSTIGGSVDSSTYSVSIHAKAGERTRIRMFDNNQVTSGDTYFDLSAGTIISGSGRIQSVGNGWYRCTIFPIKDFSTNSVLYVTLISTGQTVSYTGNGFSGAYLWGAQVETGAFATSYIPTVASQVTRSADSATMTGTNFSSWYRADEGTLYAEAYGCPTTTNRTIVRLNSSSSGATFADSIYLDQDTGSVRGVVFNGSTSQAVLSPLTTNPSTSQTVKASIAYKTNDFAGSGNGTSPLTDTSGLLPAVVPTYLYIGSMDISVAWSSPIKKIAFYPKRLTNAELQGLTTI